MLTGVLVLIKCYPPIDMFLCLFVLTSNVSLYINALFLVNTTTRFSSKKINAKIKCYEL